MKLLDANILLYAYDASSSHHARCRSWLEHVLSEDEPIGLPWQTALAFIRIATNPRAVRVPIGTAEACTVIQALIERPQVVIVEPGERFWPLFRGLIDSARISGPLITDTALAALALENGATLCSTDRDFRRFDQLRILDPSVTP